MERHSVLRKLSSIIPGVEGFPARFLSSISFCHTRSYLSFFLSFSLFSSFPEFPLSLSLFPALSFCLSGVHIYTNVISRQLLPRIVRKTQPSKLHALVRGETRIVPTGSIDNTMKICSSPPRWPSPAAERTLREKSLILRWEGSRIGNCRRLCESILFCFIYFYVGWTSLLAPLFNRVISLFYNKDRWQLLHIKLVRY